MKTISDYPFAIGGMLARAAARQARRRAVARAVQALCNGLLRWLLWPLLKFGTVLVLGLLLFLLLAR